MEEVRATIRADYQDRRRYTTCAGSFCAIEGRDAQGNVCGTWDAMPGTGRSKRGADFVLGVDGRQMHVDQANLLGVPSDVAALAEQLEHPHQECDDDGTEE